MCQILSGQAYHDCQCTVPPLPRRWTTPLPFLYVSVLSSSPEPRRLYGRPRPDLPRTLQLRLRRWTDFDDSHQRSVFYLKPKICNFFLLFSWRILLFMPLFSIPACVCLYMCVSFLYKLFWAPKFWKLPVIESNICKRIS